MRYVIRLATDAIAAVQVGLPSKCQLPNNFIVSLLRTVILTMESSLTLMR